MSWRRRLTFWFAYLLDQTPWDTGVTPPEVVDTIAGREALSPGRAIDLGCGTGTNVIYLAKHGWDAVGVDFVAKAIDEARAKAERAGVGDRTRFFAGDVTRLHEIAGLNRPFDLALDIGCLHSLSGDGRARYAAQLPHWLRVGGTYMLYAWVRDPEGEDQRGISPQALKTHFTPSFEMRCVQRGVERGQPSAWYWFELAPKK
jgi:cyclopropane fatty-acyl-phospholipid synthase-like methyltransferase